MVLLSFLIYYVSNILYLTFKVYAILSFNSRIVNIKVVKLKLISYDPFWDTLKDKEISTYALITKHGISKGTIHRMKHNFSLSTRTVNDLCRIIRCNVQDIMTYIDEDSPET